MSGERAGFWGTTAMAERVERFCVAGLYLAAFSLPFSKALLEVGVTTALLAWPVARYCSWRSGGRFWPQWQNFHVLQQAILVFIVANLLSLAVSTDVKGSARGFILKTLEQLSLVIVAADILRHPRRLRRWLLALAGGFFVVGFDGLVQYVTGTDLLYHRASYIAYRVSATFKNPNSLAGYLVTVGPLSISFLLAGRGAVRWIAAAGAGVFGLLVLGSYSVAALLAILVSLAVLAAISGRRLIWGVLLGVFLLAGVTATTWWYPRQKLHRLISGTDAGFQDRLHMWRAGWRMAQDRPWLGHGPNTFMGRYLAYWVDGEQQPRYAHNCYLQLLAELGVVGLVTFGAMLAVIIGMVGGGLGDVGRGLFERAVLIGLLAGLSGYLVQAALDTIFYELQLSLLFFMVAGAGIAAREAAKEPVTA